MTIFTRTYDFVSWLIPKMVAFPRHQRFVVTRRLQDSALNFQEYLIEANRQRGGPRLERLRQADAALDKVRLYLRLAVRWQWLSEAQYQHVSRMVKEIGDLLGGGSGRASAPKAVPCDGLVRGPVVETPGCCGAVPGTTTATTPAVATATGTTRTTATTTTGFGW
jgi:hypothetical protein